MAPYLVWIHHGGISALAADGGGQVEEVQKLYPTDIETQIMVLVRSWIQI